MVRCKYYGTHYGTQVHETRDILWSDGDDVENGVNFVIRNSERFCQPDNPTEQRDASSLRRHTRVGHQQLFNPPNLSESKVTIIFKSASHISILRSAACHLYLTIISYLEQWRLPLTSLS